jgi:hypothetical protein
VTSPACSVSDVPFTPSHAAAVLPFLRTPMPASALVVGSMAPDLPYYVPVEFPWRTHTALALVTTDLVLGAVAWAVWHALLSAPALVAAPAPLRGRLRGIPLGLRPRLGHVRLWWTALALVVGAGTHVLWDEFTHPRRWGTTHVPALGETWALLPGYRWLQYASGLIGGAILLVWFVRWWRRTPAQPAGPTPGAWRAWGLIATGLAVGAVAASSASSLGSAGFQAATNGGGAALAAAVLLALAWHLRRQTVRPAG